MFRGCLDGATIWWVSSSWPVATSIWRAAKGILSPAAVEVSEAERRILLHGGGSLTIKSAMNPNGLIGSIDGIDGAVLDEAARHDPLVWQRSIRPALADTGGWAMFLSTPLGMNHFYDLFQMAGETEGWSRWQEPSFANEAFDVREIDRARAEGLPSLLIDQEFYARFVATGLSRTYHAFEVATHVRECAYRPGMPLDCAVSFAVAPPAWIVSQGDIARGYDEHVLDEIAPPADDTSMRALFAAFKSKFPQHANGQGVRFYVGVRERDGASYSDHEILRGAFPRAKLYNTGDVRADKNAINAANLLMRGPSGEVRAAIDPRCTKLLRDLEHVTNAADSFKVDASNGLGAFASAWGAGVERRYPLFAGGHLLKTPVVSSLDAMDRHVLDKLRKAGS